MTPKCLRCGECCKTNIPAPYKCSDGECLYLVYDGKIAICRIYCDKPFPCKSIISSNDIYCSIGKSKLSLPDSMLNDYYAKLESYNWRDTMNKERNKNSNG